MVRCVGKVCENSIALYELVTLLVLILVFCTLNVDYAMP